MPLSDSALVTIAIILIAGGAITILLALAHGLTSDKETPRKHVTLVAVDARPVSVALYAPCLRCGRRPHPDHAPHCICGVALARVVGSVETDDEPTLPGAA